MQKEKEFKRKIKVQKEKGTKNKENRKRMVSNFLWYRYRLKNTSNS